MVQQYDPDKHCGAKTRSRDGEPCTRPKGWGTNHVGSGRCKLHGGRCTGPKTEEGKRASTENLISHGMYSTVLKGNKHQYYNEVKKYTNQENLQETYWMLQSLIMAALDGDVRVKRKFDIVISTIEVLVEKGKMSAEDALEAKLLLGGVTLETLTRAAVNAAALTDKIRSEGVEGDYRRQLALFKTYLLDILQQCPDPTARQLSLNLITQLKMDAGLPVRRIAELLEGDVVEQQR